MPVNDKHGFAFLPLGRVEAVPDSAWDPEANSRTLIWRDTGYILGVLTNGRKGNYPRRAGEVWLLFNMFEENPYDIEKSRIEEHEHDFGRIKPGDPDLRAGFAIADSFEDLHDEFEWNVEKFIEGSYIVTAAMLFPTEKHGKVIVRQDRGRKTAWEEEMRKNKMAVDENSDDEPDFRRR